MNPQVVKRVREFCELTSLVNAETNEFIPENTPRTGPVLTKKFSEWKITTVDEWNILVENEIDWLIQNKVNVLKNINQVLQEGWVECCEMIKYIIKSAK